MKLTRSTINAIQPGSEMAFYWDDGLKGFGLRVSPTGLMTFIVRYRVGKGRRAQQRLEKIGRYGAITPEEARSEARRRLSRATLGEDPLGEERARLAEITIAELIEKWAVEGAPIHRRTGRLRKPRSVEQDIRQMRTHVTPLLGRRRLSTIRASDFSSLRTAIRLGETKAERKTRPRGVQRITGGDGTAIRVLAVFKSVLGWAEKQDLLEWSPGRKVSLPQAKKQTIQPLGPDQYRLLGAALRQLMLEHQAGVTIILLLALTGARKSEVEKLRWYEVAPDGRTWRLGDAKTDKRVLFIPPVAAELVARQARHNGSPFVFPATRGDGHFQDMPKVWRKALVLAGLPKAIQRKHLRHSYASHGARLGVPAIFMQQLMGHSNISTTDLYYHTEVAAVRDASVQMGHFFSELLLPAPNPLPQAPRGRRLKVV